jgi:hypothetical protein
MDSGLTTRDGGNAGNAGAITSVGLGIFVIPARPSWMAKVLETQAHFLVKAGIYA